MRWSHGINQLDNLAVSSNCPSCINGQAHQGGHLIIRPSCGAVCYQRGVVPWHDDESSPEARARKLCCHSEVHAIHGVRRPLLTNGHSHVSAFAPFFFLRQSLHLLLIWRQQNRVLVDKCFCFLNSTALIYYLLKKTLLVGTTTSILEMMQF